MILPEPKKSVPAEQVAYKEFLNGVAELTNSFLKPDVKSKWVKIDLIMVATAYFKQVLLSLGINKQFSVKESRHPTPLKKESSIALFYNVYDISVVTALFASAGLSEINEGLFSPQRRGTCSYVRHYSEREAHKSASTEM